MKMYIRKSGLNTITLCLLMKILNTSDVENGVNGRRQLTKVCIKFIDYYKIT